jgi:hypothetical protein
MNDKDATNFPEEPVAEVGAKDRRRVRLRRSGQILATAAVVSACTVSGVALRPAPAAESVATGAGSLDALPGRPPKVAQVLGSWSWVGSDPSGRSSMSEPSFVTFSHESIVFHVKPITTTPLYWTGSGGCLDGWQALVGAVHLRPDGHFSISRDFLSISCDPGSAGTKGTTLSNVLRGTRWLRLVDGDLQFYDVHRHLLGTFSKF